MWSSEKSAHFGFFECAEIAIRGIKILAPPQFRGGKATTLV